MRRTTEQSATVEHLRPSWLPASKPNNINNFSIIPLIRRDPLQTSQISAPKNPIPLTRRPLDKSTHVSSGGLDGKAWQLDPSKSRRTRNSNGDPPLPLLPPAPRKKRAHRKSPSEVAAAVDATAADLPLRRQRIPLTITSEGEKEEDLSPETQGPAPLIKEAILSIAAVTFPTLPETLDYLTETEEEEYILEDGLEILPGELFTDQPLTPSLSLSPPASTTPKYSPPARPFFSPEYIGHHFPGSFPPPSPTTFPLPQNSRGRTSDWWDESDSEMPTMEEFSRMLDEKLKAQLEPIKDQLKALKDENLILKSPASARKRHLDQRRAEHEKWLADSANELKSIEDGTWEKPLVLDHMVNVNLNPSGLDSRGGQSQSTRFRPESLPKLTFEADLDTWIIRMDHVTRLWGETVVCPHIHTNSFVNGDTIEIWYLTLDTILQQAMTEHPGCWDRFKTMMRSKWAKPDGVKQNECDNRTKLPFESYGQYCVAKTQLCKMAFPGSTDAAIIQKIRSRLDIEANRFCREKDNLNRFHNELVEFDSTSPPVPPKPSQEPLRNLKSKFEDHTRKPEGDHSGARHSGKRQSDLAGNRQDPAARKLSVRDRLNPATNKMTRSFTTGKGEVRFIERPCDICSSKGKTAWHFRFECPDDPRLKTYLSELFPSTFDNPAGTSGMQLAPYTGNPTSYNFLGDGLAYASAVMRYDEGFNSSDSDSENGARSQ